METLSLSAILWLMFLIYNLNLVQIFLVNLQYLVYYFHHTVSKCLSKMSLFNTVKLSLSQTRLFKNFGVSEYLTYRG